MARPGQIDQVIAGLADIPEKLRGPRVLRYLAVYLTQLNLIEELAQVVLDAFVQWQTTGAQLDFVLDTIGALLDQPRPDNFDNTAYTFILQARTLVRQSSATRDDVIRVATFLAQGNPVSVVSVAPKVLIVEFVDLVLTPQEQDLYEQLLLGAIDAVDGLDVIYATAATAVYDVGNYDEDLYG